jgi:Winged helix DNA-binding domain
MAWPTMSTGALDPLIHDPERLRIVATLAALPDGDALSATRLQDMTGLTPSSQITRLRELDHAGYIRTDKTGDDGAQITIALTCDGRIALDRYTTALRQLPQAARADHQAPAPDVRVSDADRDAAAALPPQWGPEVLNPRGTPSEQVSVKSSVPPLARARPNRPYEAAMVAVEASNLAIELLNRLNIKVSIVCMNCHMKMVQETLKPCQAERVRPWIAKPDRRIPREFTGIVSNLEIYSR